MSSLTGAAIRAARHERGLTQKQLAERAGLSEIAIKRIEGGKNAPSSDSLQRLAQALDVSIDTLMGRNDILASPAPPVPTWRAWGVDEAQIARAAAVWSALSRDQRARVHGSFDVSTRALHAVDSLIEQVQVRIDTLRAQVQEADDPPATDEPIRPQDAIEVQSNKHSLRHKALSLG